MTLPQGVFFTADKGTADDDEANNVDVDEDSGGGAAAAACGADGMERRADGVIVPAGSAFTLAFCGTVCVW